MSKNTPEIGDIFYNEKLDEKIYIYKIWEKDKKEKFIKILLKETYGLFLEDYLLEDINFESMKYLGKSKTNVEQLFEVEDNGRCIEDNTPHAESTILFKMEVEG